ncbi:hypothetical protein ACLE20_13250 [Rhizobium sp. YIM 134829]|uniref:hypothetical protein n=1 Tax=Rhizobium sp. YIM 134829 TaxID=3390453 RepID=UPI00397B2D53
MDVQAAVKKITDRADALPRREALRFLEDTIEQQQAQCLRFANSGRAPKGWSYGKHSDLIAMLISATNERRDARVVA